jgi:multisubunit Na+/H+ antiporter MnhB subunit
VDAGRVAEPLAGREPGPAGRRAIAVGTGLLVTLHHLAWSAGRSRIDNTKSWDETWTFQAGGPITVALALCGLAVGVLVALVWRRSLAALGAAAVGTVAVRYGISQALPHLWPTLTRVVPIGGNGPEYGGAMVVETGVVTASGAHRPIPDCVTSSGSVCDKAYEAMHATGYYTEYHSQSQYWGLQLAATGVLLALTAVLVAVAFRVLRRRTGATAAQ